SANSRTEKSGCMISGSMCVRAWRPETPASPCTEFPGNETPPRTWFAVRAIFALLTLAVVCGSCDARSRMWKVQVEQRGDLPCFTVEDDETGGTARARFVSVSEIDSRGAEKQVAWRVSASGTARLPLSSGKCLEYAAAIPDATVNTPAQPLQPGR